VHALVVKPPGFRPGRRYPVLLMIHGGPQGMSGDSWHPRWNAQLFAAPGYVVIMPNFHGSKGYGQGFCDSIRGDWGGKPYRDVMKAVDAVVARYRFVDKRRICAIGASYGGYLVNWIGTHTRRFRCLVSHAGVFDLRSKYGTTEELWFPEREFKGTPWTNPKMYRRWSPSTYIKQWRTPTLVIHGQHDYRVTVGQGMQLFTALQRMGVPSKFLYFPDEDHFVQKPQNRLLWWRTVHRFLARHLQPGAHGGRRGRP
jgi:dipeptidyl aminopeptidase/acylaminoacyl peptidase